MDRLKSRFSWGIPVDVKSPDKELRINILKRKLDFLISNPSDVPEECLETIAELFTNNIRELEGALRRFVTYCISMDVPFTNENAIKILEQIVPKTNSDFQDTNDKKIKEIKDIQRRRYLFR